MNKTDQQLKDEQARNEVLGQLTGGLIILGLIVEVVLAILYPSGRGLVNDWGSVGADILIAVDVFLEIFFSRRALQRASELQSRSETALSVATERAAEANERAARLEKEAAEARERTAEIERLTAWRHISPEQSSRISDTIRDKASILDVLIEHERGNVEAYSYAREFAQTFVAAGVKRIRGYPNSYFGVVFGLLVSVSKDIDSDFIRNAFSSAQIEIWLTDNDLSTHLPRTEPAPNLYIFVAPKPPPPLIVPAAGAAHGSSAAQAVSATKRE